MRIIKKGKLPPKKELEVFQHICENCSTEFEYNLLDLKLDNGSWMRLVAICPFCKKKIILVSHHTTAYPLSKLQQELWRKFIDETHGKQNK